MQYRAILHLTQVFRGPVEDPHARQLPSLQYRCSPASLVTWGGDTLRKGASFCSLMATLGDRVRTRPNWGLWNSVRLSLAFRPRAFLLAGLEGGPDHEGQEVWPPHPVLHRKMAVLQVGVQERESHTLELSQLLLLLAQVAHQRRGYDGHANVCRRNPTA